MNFLSENSPTFSNQNIFKMETSYGGLLPNNNSIKTTENKIFKNDRECNKNQSIKQVWTKENFGSHKGMGPKKTYLKANLSLDLKPLKTSWASKNNENDKVEEELDESEFTPETKEVFSPILLSPEKEAVSPSHHARRPMNAFLIFCKKHRPIVRQKFPHLENRGVTRILGEWWALLDVSEKCSYTDLAKEHKDAFFSANPDFKWYKLPAPPLRTLNTRPTVVSKTISPLASPIQTSPNSAEFTPGKLADETQLGNLTSLMKTNNNFAKTCDNSDTNAYDMQPDVHVIESNTYANNNNYVKSSELQKHLLSSPDALCKFETFPPKPIKKRKYEYFDDNEDNKDDPRSLYEIENLELPTDDQNDYIEDQNFASDPENMTQQELMNKVVDSMFPDKDMNFNQETTKISWILNEEKLNETRKSGRSCKGKRYAEFMMEGKLFGNKHMKRFTQYRVDVNNKFDYTLNNKIENMMHNKSKMQTSKDELGDAMKHLTDRTSPNLENVYVDTTDEVFNNNNEKRVRTESENSDDSLVKTQTEFNLNLRIAELPSLSYEIFMQRKKDSKKRKSVRTKSESYLSKTKAAKLSKSENSSLVGSKKRKNKSSIIRLEKPIDPNYISDFNTDLYGLATLAEVAANTEKIN